MRVCSMLLCLQQVFHAFLCSQAPISLLRLPMVAAPALPTHANVGSFLCPCQVFRSAPLSASTSSSASASSAAHKQQGQQQHHHHHHQAHAPQVVPTPGASPVQQRLELELAGRGISHFSFVRVPGDYYDRPLEARQVRGGVADVHVTGHRSLP